MVNHAHMAGGCLLIDGFTPGEASLSGLFAALERSGVATKRFASTGETLREELLRAYWDVRSPFDASSIAAVGTGCWAALALAEQLPVDRLALVFPPADRSFPHVSPPLRRQLLRMLGFARRNLPLCVADTIAVLAPGDEPAPWLKRLPGLREYVFRVKGSAPAGATIDKKTDFGMETAISRFLRTGELPKSLAEISEMCIIYG